MIPAELHDITVEASRVLFVLLLPILGVVTFAGTLVAAALAATSLKEPAVAYVARLIALVAVVALMFDTFQGVLIPLAQEAWG